MMNLYRTRIGTEVVAELTEIDHLPLPPVINYH